MEKFKKIPKVYWYLLIVLAFAGYFAWKSLAMQAGPKLILSNQNNSISDNSIAATVAVQFYYYEVAGQVKNPGVYKAFGSLLVDEALKLAGGFTGEADLEFVYRNIALAVKVKPEQKIFIPSKNSQNPSSLAGATSFQDNKININTASSSQIEEISGVGPATSMKIINGRPYQACDDINKLVGVNKTTKANIIAVCSL